MPRVQLPAVTPKQVCSIRARLELANNLRDLALLNVAIDSKLRGCDLMCLKVRDLDHTDQVRERDSMVQIKTKRSDQFELTFELWTSGICRSSSVSKHEKIIT